MTDRAVQAGGWARADGGSAAVLGSRIAAVGHYQPARVMTNDELAELVDTSDAWIRSRVGIATRHLAAEDETVADLATAAARKALDAAGLVPADIGLVVVATCTVIETCPSTAARVSAALGLPGPAVMDLNTACSGFVHALAVADHALRAGAARHAIVVGAEKLSAFTDWTDRSTCVLLGDGAGAAVLSAVPADGGEPREGEPPVGVGPVRWGSAPEMAEAIRIAGTPPVFAQEGQAVFRWATTELPKLALETCAAAGLAPEDLAAFVPHQANLRIIEPLARRLGAERAVIARDVVDSGNTSAASIPLALSKLVERGEVATGAPVLLFGFGGGLAYAGMVVRCP